MARKLEANADALCPCTMIIQTRILGPVIAPSQWQFPLTDDRKMGMLSMDNDRTRATIN